MIVDVQRDFLPGGALAVSNGDEVVEPLNEVSRIFAERSLLVFAIRDWHPRNHCSFREHGGPWPVHCVVNTPGASFADSLQLPTDTTIISKGDRDDDCYSAFDGTGLEAQLRALGVRRLWVGGLATDYCVRATVKSALSGGFAVVLLTDAVRAVNVRPTDGDEALAEMQQSGAILATAKDAS